MCYFVICVPFVALSTDFLLPQIYPADADMRAHSRIYKFWLSKVSFLYLLNDLWNAAVTLQLFMFGMIGKELHFFSNFND